MSGSRLAADALKTGLPLPWDLCDEAGRLLLRRGFVVESASQLTRLLQAGLYRRSPGNGAGQDSTGVTTTAAVAAAASRVDLRRSSTVFSQVAVILDELETLLSKPEAGSFAEQVMRLAIEIQTCFALDPDASIATVQMLKSNRYSTRRLVHAAILMELLLAHGAEPVQQRRLALAAALTMNIAMLAMQDILNHQSTAPDPQQKALLRQHPERGVEELRRLGVEEPLWLSMVEQHHETIDGKGYPRGRAGQQVGRYAQILSMVDRYGSMAIGRAYRAPALPNLVLKQIFLDKHSVDPELAALLLSAVGMYPPGSLVALASGELAVVLRRTSVASQPLVKVLKTGRGKLLDRPRRRLTSEPAHAITRLVSNQELGFAIDPALLWDEAFDLAKPANSAKYPG